MKKLLLLLFLIPNLVMGWTKENIKNWEESYIPGCMQAFKKKQYYNEFPLELYELYCYCLSDYIIENLPVSKINNIDFAEISKTGGNQCSEKINKKLEVIK
ncbi:MAG: hypothetical protein O3C61_07520 [Proteobacteria bacterium]|nr:hypothetical protein [Pseudomonadota bacterium]